MNMYVDRSARCRQTLHTPFHEALDTLLAQPLTAQRIPTAYQGALFISQKRAKPFFAMEIFYAKISDHRTKERPQQKDAKITKIQYSGDIAGSKGSVINF
jgi:hypothetical protein